MNCCGSCIANAKYKQCNISIGCPSSLNMYDYRGGQLNNEMKNSFNDYRFMHVHKILILGDSSSGKSTIFKSVKHVNGGYVNNSEVFRECIHVIRQNCVAGILRLLRKSQELYESDILKCFINVHDDDIRANIQSIVNYNNESFTEALNYNEVEQLGKSIKSIWNLPVIQQTFAFIKKKSFWFPDNMDLFFNKVEYIMTQRFESTIEDLLTLRVRTTGSIHYTFNKHNHEFALVDLGGERNERKKWIHYFEGTSCVLFTVPLNHYCKALFEEEKCIALLESLDLFGEICNSKWFRKTNIIILLNKTDLFREFLKCTPLTFCFGKQYKGRNFINKFMNKNDILFNMRIVNRLILRVLCDFTIRIPMDIISIMMKYIDLSEWWLDLCYEDGIEFIKQKYLSLNMNPDKTIFVYTVSAVIPEQVGKIMNDVYHIIIKSNLFCAPITF